MTRQVISTNNAPEAIGPYSQAARAGDMIYYSGQIPLVPETMKLVGTEFQAQARQVFKNLSAVVEASGASLSDVVKINLYLVDLSNFKFVNDILTEFFDAPYPARAAVEVSALPAGAQVEAEAVAYVGQ